MDSASLPPATAHGDTTTAGAAALAEAIRYLNSATEATGTAVITDETFAAPPEILNPRQDGFHDTDATAPPIRYATVGQLAEPPTGGWLPHLSGWRPKGEDGTEIGARRPR